MDSKQLFQTLEVLTDGENYYVVGSFDRRELVVCKSACTAIQRAMELLPPTGGTILVGPGEFNLLHTIKMRSQVSLRGQGPATTLRMLPGHVEGTALLFDTVDRAEVADLSLKATRGAEETAQIGIDLLNSGVCRVTRVGLFGMSKIGVIARDFSFLCQVEECEFAGIGGSAIYFNTNLRPGTKTFGRGGDWVQNRIVNNIIYGCDKGIDLQQSVVVDVLGNSLHMIAGIGIHLRHACSVLLNGNRTYQISGQAAVVVEEGSKELNITGNIFCWSVGHGIVLSDVTWGTVTGNEIIDPGSVNPPPPPGDEPMDGHLFEPAADFPRRAHMRHGILLTGRSECLSIVGNSIFNWGNVLPLLSGITEEADCKFNSIIGNNVNLAEHGTVSRGEGSCSQGNTEQLNESLCIGTNGRLLHRFDTRKIPNFIKSQY